MTDVLGYKRYGAHGGDWGTTITEQLARDHNRSVVGIHLTDVPFWHVFQPPKDPTRDEAAFLEENAAWQKTEGAYTYIQGTRPATLAAALRDSPVGRAAWLLGGAVLQRAAMDRDARRRTFRCHRRTGPPRGRHP